MTAVQPHFLLRCPWHRIRSLWPCQNVEILVLCSRASAPQHLPGGHRSLVSLQRVPNGLAGSSPSLERGQPKTEKDPLYSAPKGAEFGHSSPLCCTSAQPGSCSAPSTPTADGHCAAEEGDTAAALPHGCCSATRQPLPSLTLIQCRGAANTHVPQVPTALSTPEGLPWITPSPWKAHLLIKVSSSSVHLKGKKMTPVHNRDQHVQSDRRTERGGGQALLPWKK